MIQAMIWALVPTSGAGMSCSGPMMMLISVAKRRVSRSSSLSRASSDRQTTPPLAPPYGKIDERALPGHPHRQRLHLVEADVGVVADAALGRAAAKVVLDAVAGEDLDAAVVHLHREVNGQLAAWLAQHAAKAGIEVEMFGGEIELPLRNRPWVDLDSSVFGCHRAETSGRGGRCHLVETGRLPDEPTGAEPRPCS